MSTALNYPNAWIPVPFTCKCGVNVRVDVEAITGPFAAQSYQHCNDDEGQLLPGPILAVSEEREGKWVVVERYI
jgi:hypothetical protein